MSELFAPGIFEPEPGIFSQGLMMRLYCWSCRTAHGFSLEDVERIVYALDGMYVTAHGSRDDEPGESECLNRVLHYADDIECYAEHVEQGIECRRLTP